MHSRLSMRSSGLPYTGTPMTVSHVLVASMPDKCAAPPAAPMIILISLKADFFTDWIIFPGLLWAEVIVTLNSIPSSSKRLIPGASMKRSETEPIVTATRGEFDSFALTRAVF